MISENCQEKTSYLKSHCLTERTVYIYGLYDVRLQDIFYVGSTFYLAERFSKHMQRAKEPYNFKSMWLQNIIESGSYPLPILLHEFQSKCDQYARHIERETADCLRVEGHTAICDWYECPSELTAYWETLPQIQWEEENLSRDDRFNLMYALYELKLSLIEKWIERISEQAHVTAMLKEIFEA
jgi:hypothetical protein